MVQILERSSQIDKSLLLHTVECKGKTLFNQATYSVTCGTVRLLLFKLSSRRYRGTDSTFFLWLMVCNDYQVAELEAGEREKHSSCIQSEIEHRILGYQPNNIAAKKTEISWFFFALGRTQGRCMS